LGTEVTYRRKRINEEKEKKGLEKRMDYLEGESITVEAGRKAVRVLNWGSQPFTRVPRKDGSLAWIPHGFQCITKEAGLQLLGETSVDIENGPAMFRFSVIGQAKAVGEWRANPTAALDNIHALVKNNKHRVGANGNVVIGIAYDNLQRRVNELRSACATIEKVQEPRKSHRRMTKASSHRRSSRLARQSRTIEMAVEQGVSRARLDENQQPTMKRQRVESFGEMEGVTYDFPPLEDLGNDSLLQESIFITTDEVEKPMNMEEDLDSLATMRLFDRDIDILAWDLGIDSMCPNDVLAEPEKEVGMQEEKMPVVDDKKDFHCPSSNTGAFDYTSADDLLQATDGWWSDDLVAA